MIHLDKAYRDLVSAIKEGGNKVGCAMIKCKKACMKICELKETANDGAAILLFLIVSIALSMVFSGKAITGLLVVSILLAIYGILSLYNGGCGEGCECCSNGSCCGRDSCMTQLEEYNDLVRKDIASKNRIIEDLETNISSLEKKLKAAIETKPKTSLDRNEDVVKASLDRNEDVVKASPKKVPARGKKTESRKPRNNSKPKK